MKMKILALFVLVGSVVILLLANLVITVRLTQEIEETKSLMQLRRSLPCEAVPIKWAVDNPDCANRLLEAMNVTNVRFLPRGNLSSMRYYNNTSLARIRKR